MACKVEFLPDAAKDFAALDGSVKKEAARKIDALYDLSLGPFGSYPEKVEHHLH